MGQRLLNYASVGNFQQQFGRARFLGSSEDTSFWEIENEGPYWSHGVTIFHDRLYIGTYNYANGGEIWQFLPNRVHLALVVRR